MKNFLGGIAAFWAALWSTLKELADSKKAVVSFLAVAINIGAQFFPQYQAQLDRVLPSVDAFFILLVAAIGLIDALNAHRGNAVG